MTQRRFVSMRNPHLAALETTFLAENWSGTLEIRSALDGTVVNAGVPRYRQLNGEHLVPLGTEPVGEDGISLTVETSQSRVEVADGGPHPCSRRRVDRGRREGEPRKRPAGSARRSRSSSRRVSRCRLRR